MAKIKDDVVDERTKENKRIVAERAAKLNAKAPRDLRRPLNHMEQEALQILFATGEYLDNLREVLKPRLVTIKRANQRVGLMQWCARSLFRDILSQMDVQVADRFAKTAQVMRCECRPTGVSSVPRTHDETIVNCQDLYTLVESVYRHECMMCNKRGKEVKRCKLKKGLDNMMILTAHETVDEGGCWYQL